MQLSWCRRTPPPAYRSQSVRSRTRCSGRWSPSASPEVKSSPLLFGYRGAEPVDVGSIERLITKVAHLQNDLPEVSALQLSLALAGVNGATVLTASVRLAPVRDPRPDSLVRRLPDATVTLPG